MYSGYLALFVLGGNKLWPWVWIAVAHDAVVRCVVHGQWRVVMLDRLDLIDMLSRCEPQERKEAAKQFDRNDQKQADALAVLAVLERECPPRSS